MKGKQRNSERSKWIVLVLLFCQAVPSYTQVVENKTYSQVLNEIKVDRLSMQQNGTSMDSCRAYFMDCLTNKIVPYWLGTKWDFNGYTNVPGKDKLIACGYFVTTTLKHMGMNWNRYDLAKLYSTDLVKKTCTDSLKFTEKEACLNHLAGLSDNLYLVGLKFHVGFLMRWKGSTWFIHSNYYNQEGPVKEIATESKAFSDSEFYYLGTFLSDENLTKWLRGVEIGS